MAGLVIERAGLLTTVQDLGRWGFQSSGVPVCGALDTLSHRVANRLVGNADDAATLEVTLTGPRVRFESAVTLAVAGAPFRLTLDGVAVSMGEAVSAEAGSVLAFGERLGGARAYIAVSGGIDVPLVLGSRSTHLLTAMGGYKGRALRASDCLPWLTGSDPLKRGLHPSAGFSGGEGGLRVIVGDEELAKRVLGRRFRVSPQSNRMGYRLEGALGGGAGGNVISTAVPTGAIQVPPGGEPILLMNDHATTGGYAVAATVISADLPRAGQLAPGDFVSFEACSLGAAMDALREQEARLGRV